MKKLSALSLKRFILLLFLLAALLTVFLAWCTPMFSDDYYFISLGYTNAGEILDFAVHYDDGRLLGNAGVVALLNSPALCIAVKALVTAVFVVMLPLCLGAKNKLSYLLSFLLLFGLSPAIFGQSVTWTSGFQNYLPPTLLLCVCFLLWRHADEGGSGLFILRALGMLILAAAAQLYMENNALVNLAAALIALVISCRRGKRSVLLSILWLLGGAAGAGVLFLLPKLVEHPVLRFTSFSRRIYLDSLSSMLGALWTYGLKAFDYIADCTVLLSVMGLTVFGILQRSKAAWKKPGWHRAASAVSLLLPLWVIGRRLLFSAYTRNHLYEAQQLLFALLCIAFLVAFIAALAHLGDRPRLTLVCILWALAVFSFAPLLVTSIFSERCLFLFACLAAAAVIVSFEWLGDKLPRKGRELLARLGAMALVLLCLGLGGEYNAIRMTGGEIADYIAEKLDDGATEIKLPRIPSEYVFRDTSSFLGNYYYREAQNDVSFTFTDYSSWSTARTLEQNLKNR